MVEITLESLAARPDVVERQLAVFQKLAASPPVPAKDWRRVVGLFSDSELARQVDAETAAAREAEREAARNGLSDDGEECSFIVVRPDGLPPGGGN